MEISADDVLEILDSASDVSESYVLVREIKLYADVGSPYFHPKLGIKIWKSWALSANPYSFELSHHAHTPTQAGPYHPSRVHAETERQAIDLAIDALTSFIRSAIRQGHEPDDSWLVPNPDF